MRNAKRSWLQLGFAAVWFGLAGQAETRGDSMLTPVTYQSQGWIGSGNPIDINPDSDVHFQGIDNGVFRGGESFSIGTFSTTAPIGATPRPLDGSEKFTILVNLRSNQPFMTDTIEIDGHITGWLQPGQDSFLRATVDTVGSVAEPTIKSFEPDLGPFFSPSGRLVTDPSFDITIAPDGRGSYTLEAQVRLVPEPSVMSLGLVAVLFRVFTRRRCRPKFASFIERAKDCEISANWLA